MWVNAVRVNQKSGWENWPIWRSEYFKSDVLCERFRVRGTWLIHIWDINHPYEGHDSLIRETWLIHIFMCVYFLPWLFTRAMVHGSHIWDMTYSYVGHDSFICGHDSLIRGTSRIHMCLYLSLAHCWFRELCVACVCSCNPFIRRTRPIHMRDTWVCVFLARCWFWGLRVGMCMC